MDPDDIAYRKSVRNVSVVLAAIVVTIFAALLIPPYINPIRNNFQKKVSIDSSYPFTLSLELNTTMLASDGYVTVTVWVNSTSSAIENITAKDAWGLDHSRLRGRFCTNDWPIGVGLMEGHYSSGNYTR